MAKAIAYTIKRSFRKTITLRITQDATLEVLAPMRMERKRIEQFIMEKSSWVQQNIEKQQQINKERTAYALGEILFLGTAYPAKIYDGKKVMLRENAVWLPDVGLEEQRIKMLQWYKHQAKQILPMRAQQFAKEMDAEYQNVKVTSAKTRWGSCTGKKNVNFSWRLITAPADALDYVVIHELAHLKHMDHSPQFWAEVEAHCKNYKQMQQKLKQTQEALSLQGW